MRKSGGFTLIELIVTIAILAIGVTMVVPGFSHLTAHEQRIETVMSLTHALNFARVRSIATRKYVAVCKSRNGTQCGDDSTTWGDGWIVFVNDDHDWQVDAGEKMLLQHGAVSAGITLTANRDAFNFRPTSLRSTAGSLFVCSGNRRFGTAVIVSVVGRVRTSAKHGGEPVDCD